jgi:membrane protease YdiL (CAAX protease family)
MIRLLKNSTPASRIFYLFSGSLLGLFLTGALVTILSGIFGWNDRDSVWFIRLNTFLQSLFMFFLPAICIAVWTDSPSKYLNLQKSSNFYIFITSAVLLFVVAMPMISLTTQLNERMALPKQLADIEAWMRNSEQAAETVTQKLLQGKDLLGFMSNILLIGAFTAVSEEFFFRGVLQREIELWTKNGHWSVWITAFIFSAIHLQFFGFFPRLILGALLGYLFLFSRNLWVPITAHFFNNASVIVVNFFVGKEALDQLNNPPVTSWLIMLSVASAFFCVILLKKLKQISTSQTLRLE